MEELGATGQVASIVRKQREADAGSHLAFSSFSSLGPSPVNGATHSTGLSSSINLT